jgi:hypothetical protein
MFRFVLIGVLLTATAHVAHGQSVKNAPVICVHGEGAWNPKDSVLTVITFSKGCDVATASRTYSWTKEDDEDFGGMVIAQTNLMTFASACLQQETANNTKDCDQTTHNLIAVYLHAARAKRESLCSRHPDWWVVNISDSGSFGSSQSCGD